MVAYLTYCCTGRSLPLGVAFSRPPLYSIGGMRFGFIQGVAIWEKDIVAAI